MIIFENIEIMKDWFEFKNVKELEFFLGFMNYYRDYVRNFVEYVELLYKLVSKKLEYKWID